MAAGEVKENIIENKKDDMVDNMGQASCADSQGTYLPTPRLIQKAKDAKNLAVALQPDGKVRLKFRDERVNRKI